MAWKRLTAIGSAVVIVLGLAGCYGPSGTTSIEAQSACTIGTENEVLNTGTATLQVSLTSPEWVHRDSSAPLTELRVEGFSLPSIPPPPSGSAATPTAAVASEIPMGGAIAIVYFELDGLESFTTEAYGRVFQNAIAVEVPTGYELPTEWPTVRVRVAPGGADLATVRLQGVQVIANPAVTIIGGCGPVDHEPTRLAAIEVRG